MIFGSKRDFNTLVGINRELINKVLEQEVLVYKIHLESTRDNVYGEAPEKMYFTPVKINCIVLREDQDMNNDIGVLDMTRAATYSFLREDLKTRNIVLEVGDIIECEKTYYQVDTIKENQFFLGKNSEYHLTEDGKKYGGSFSIIAECHLTKQTKLGIARVR
jgi:hypothetical protein